MNELINKNDVKLSNDINVITSEIKTYENIIGESIWEIGRRLTHVKNNNLVHGEWLNWLENDLGMSRTAAWEYMKIYREFDKNKYNGLSKGVLRELFTLPTQYHEEAKNMSVRELKELKRKLRMNEIEQSNKTKINNNNSINNLSKYEVAISMVLDTIGIEYIRNDTNHPLVGLKGGKLKFDFGCYENNKLKAYIEADGDQHTNKLNPRYSKEIECHDRFKNDYCEVYNIPLLRINYDVELSEISNIVKDFISKYYN